jgi:hypothetical protein
VKRIEIKISSQIPGRKSNILPRNQRGLNSKQLNHKTGDKFEIETS